MSSVVASPEVISVPGRRPAQGLLLVSPRCCVVLLLLLSGYLFFFGLNVGELWRTESLRAIIAREMLHSGNWIVPRLYGEPLFTKPPGMYALIALCSWPLGAVTEWTARLPSALAATGTLLLFFWYFRRQLGTGGGLLAALILPMSMLWLDKAPSAEIDMVQVAWVAASLLFFCRALEAESESTVESPELRGKDTASGSRLSFLAFHPAFIWWWLALLCVAGGFLTKWTAPAFFYVTAIPLLWWQGRLRLLWSGRHLCCAAVAILICLAWVAAAVWLEGWTIFYETVKREALQRIVPTYGHRPYPWLAALTHPLRLLAATLPWSLAALAALRPGFGQLWNDRQYRFIQALHCWVWPNMLFWSLMSEHTPRHSAPLFPGLAGLAAMVWYAWHTRRRPWPWARWQPTRVLTLALVIWLVIKVCFLGAVIPMRNANRQPRFRGEQLAALVPPGQVLYLFHLKDEGIMFYYGRAVIRLAGPEQLPSPGEPVYCILKEVEWQQWTLPRPTEVIGPLHDEQGEPIVLVRVAS